MQYIDRDPRAIARQEELEKKKKADLDHEDANRAFLERQLKIAQEVGAKDEEEELRPTKLQRSELAGEKIKISLSSKLSSSKESARGEAATFNAFAFGAAGKDGSKDSTDAGKRKRNAIDDLMAEEERRKEKQQREAAAKKAERLENWITTGIVVKIVNKKVGDGKYYKQKGVITAVEDKFGATIETVDAGDILRLDQDDLETVIPQAGRRVKIVNGTGRGSVATLKSISVDDFCARVRIESGALKYVLVAGPDRVDGILINLLLCAGAKRWIVSSTRISVNWQTTDQPASHTDK